jgi:hypothetical protein
MIVERLADTKFAIPFLFFFFFAAVPVIIRLDSTSDFQNLWVRLCFDAAAVLPCKAKLKGQREVSPPSRLSLSRRAE